MRMANNSQATRSSRSLSRQIDLNLLVLFDSIYRTRNLTATGAQMGLSQPTVSRGLARLRNAYDDALFVRQQRGVQPTPFADRLAAPLASALAMVRSTIERPTFEPATDRRAFCIAMSDVGERYFLPRLLRYVAREAPGVTIETILPSQAVLIAGLASGDIDLAAGFLPDLGKQVHVQKLFRERYVYIARIGHPVVRGTLRTEQLRTLPHVVPSPAGTGHAGAVEKVLTSPRVRAPIALRVNSFLCAGPVVADTDLIAAIPSRLAALLTESLHLQLIPPPVEMPAFDVLLAWHQRFHRDPALEWLRGVLAELSAVRPGPTAKRLTRRERTA